MAARPPTDAFHPHLPFDPFADVESGPWKPSISPHADPPAVVLVLGDPAPPDLHPILSSQSLAQSLVVVATHAPPYIPQTPVPAVRILRLAAPLVQDTGALRLVGLLERADRVVRRFRADPAEGMRKLVQLAEDSVTGEFGVEEVYSPAEPSSSLRMRTGEDIPRYPSPAPSVTSSLFSSTSSAKSTFSTASSFSRRRRARAGATSSRPVADRAFDAIINFLPYSLPDKLVLKHAILVSTLSASFVSAPPAPFPLAPAKSNQRNFSTLSFPSADANITDPIKTEKRSSRRFSSFLHRSPPAHNVPAFVHSAPCSRDELSLTSNIKGKSRSELQLSTFNRKPHLVHILPSHVYHYHPLGASSSSKKPQQPKKSSRLKAKPKLVQGIEQFLLAFGYPLQSLSLLPSASLSPPGSRSESRSRSSSFMSASVPFGVNIGTDAGEKPIPFLLAAGVFGSVPTGGNMTIGEILLMGGLDSCDAGSSGVNEIVGEGVEVNESRVWIGSPEEVVWPYDDPKSLSIGHTRNPSREIAFAETSREPAGIPSYPSAPSPTHPHPRPTRSSSTPIANPGNTLSPPPSSPIKPPPSAHPALSKPIPARASTPSLFQPSTLPLSSKAALVPPPPVHATAKLQKPRRASMFSIIPKEVNQKQLPTPPESASSLEDGDLEDDRVTTETSEMRTSVRGIPSNTASTTDLHHVSRYQQQQGKQHYVKVTSTIGHRHEHAIDATEKKGFFARLGFGKSRTLKAVKN